MLFGKLDINPAKNPAVLDTATWDPVNAWKTVQALDDAYWRSLEDAVAKGAPLPAGDGLTPYAASCARHRGALYCLASLADGQQVFLEMGDVQAESDLGAAVGVKSCSDTGSQIALHPTDAEVIDRFLQFIKPEKGPQALGVLPRLGIGTRMTTAVWPGIWRAMAQGHFAANAIQNSVRELNLLENLVAARPAEKNMAFNFGTIESGYTGSTFEGLWVAGVLDALKSDTSPRYGADADHIQVKRGADGLARAKKLVEASRYYSFFTLDVSDVLNYRALTESQATAEMYLDEMLSSDQRKAVRACHQHPLDIAGRADQPDNATLGRLVAKYWNAMNAVQELCSYISGLKYGMPFDLELSIDEHPPEVATFDCLTTETELLFLLLEMQRRGIPLTHVAPNLGIEKGTDYGCPDGLEGLEARTRSLSDITEEMGIMLDVHSGDDLSAATRRAIRRATGGRNHFKVSPMLQLLFAEVLADHHPELFRRWWNDALAYARREAGAGSAFAAECVQQCQETRSLAPSPRDSVFHHFSFAFVGRRDPQGQFLCREEFYDLSPDFYRAYQDRLVQYLCSLAAELL